MFIITETIVNIKHEELTCFKGHRCFSKNLFMSIRHMKKEIPGSYYFSFFALSNLHKPVYIFAHRAALLLNMQNVHLLFIITFVSLSLPT